jgi:V/A-type H+-transporting ATPase subunit A
MRDTIMRLLVREDELRQIVRLVGPESLAEKDKLTLEVARIIRVAFLQQNAFDDIDAFASPQKQAKMMRMIMTFYNRANDLVNKGVPVKKIIEATQDLVSEMGRVKFTVKNDELQKIDNLIQAINARFDQLASGVKA